jgi:hypothetical protein
MALKISLTNYRLIIFGILLVSLLLYLAGPGNMILQRQQATGKFSVTDYLKAANVPSGTVTVSEFTNGQCSLSTAVQGHVFCSTDPRYQTDTGVTYSKNGVVKFPTDKNTQDFSVDFLNVFPDGRIVASEVFQQQICILGNVCMDWGAEPVLTVRDISYNRDLCTMGVIGALGVNSNCLGESLEYNHIYRITITGTIDEVKTFIKFAGKQPRLYYSEPGIGQEAIPLPGTEGCKYQGWKDLVDSERLKRGLQPLDVVYNSQPTVLSGSIASGANSAKNEIETPGSVPDITTIAPDYVKDIPASSIYKEASAGEVPVRVFQYGVSQYLTLYYQDQGVQPASFFNWYDSDNTVYAAFCDMGNREWYGYRKQTYSGTSKVCQYIADSDLLLTTEASVLRAGKTFCCSNDQCPLANQVCRNGACESSGGSSQGCTSDQNCRGEKYPQFGSQAFENLAICNKDKNPATCECPLGGSPDSCLKAIACKPDLPTYQEGTCCRLKDGNWN